jgi:uncharacterized phiE125 gp8 family phage protein
MYGLKQTTPPTDEPVAVADLKAFLRLNTTSEDALLAGFISSARDLFEQQTDRQLMPATWTLYLDAFPRVIRCPKAPLNAVSSVQYYDSSDTLTTWSTANYSVDTAREPGRIVPSVWYPDWRVFPSFPALSYRISPKIIVQFTAGYADANSVPPMIKQAIMLMASHWFNQRSETTTDKLDTLPIGWKNVVAMYKLNWVSNMNRPLYTPYDLDFE